MISIIILHHSKEAYSAACVSSLLGVQYRPLQVINVDNGSTDNTAKVLLEWEKEANAQNIDAKTILLEKNEGAITGRNIALQQCDGEFIVLLDNDTLLPANSLLEELRHFLQTKPQCGIVAPKLLFPWEPYLVECCGCGISARGRVAYLHRGKNKDKVQTPQKVQAAISAAWMMRREVYQAIGGLDEVYSPVQYEDLDYCYRARQAGFEVWTNPAAQLFHFEHTTTAGSDDVNFRYVTSRNARTFKSRWQPVIAQEKDTEALDTAWKNLPKHDIQEINWQALLR